MIRSITFLALLLSCTCAFAQAKDSTYTGNDLGLTYTRARSVFKVWSPKAENVKINIYYSDTATKAVNVQTMRKDSTGRVWQHTITNDLRGIYYNYQIFYNGKWQPPFVDPYARAVNTNGTKACVTDLASTNPEGWNNDARPALKSFTDIILYELHLRDISTDAYSGIKAKGKFLGLAEQNTTVNPNKSGMAQDVHSGLAHLRDLGVTHIHILPAFDFATIDESKPELPQYNWGYDPQNYNVPEGSYASSTADPTARIREFKTMVQALHTNHMRVVMDVVYNHTHNAAESNFERMAPGYFYRKSADGTLSNASRCGNEVASERAMVRKFIVESAVYWAKEYHIDGFRFDLMGIHDLETMKAVRVALDSVDKSIFIYGEGWTAGSSPLPDSLRALKQNMSKLTGVAAFCDELRDGAKGPWNDHTKTGFVGGVQGLEASLQFGIAGGIEHPQIDYAKVNYSKSAWAEAPAQCINYVSCHDDETLWDKLQISNPKADEEERVAMDKLAQTIVFTAQGVPFLHSGEEFLRSKNLSRNSYNLPDSVNQLKWNDKMQHRGVFDYYTQLTGLRRAHPAFRMASAQMIRERLNFLQAKSNVVVFTLTEHANGDAWKNIIVILNGNARAQNIKLPQGEWRHALSSFGPANSKPYSGEVQVAATGALILYQE